MDLTQKSTIQYLLKKYNAKPEKYLGQHFLLSKNALRKTIEAAEIKSDDLIIEIGPGLGTLTQELAETGAKIIAIEKDRLMNQILEETLVDYKNIKVIQADARKLLISDINNFGDKMGISDGKDGYKKDGYKVVANLPYNIATFLIRSFLESNNPPKMMVLMIQKEVAQRICAKPPRMNILAASIQCWAEPKIIGYISKKEFQPQPKVNSAIIKLTIKPATNKAPSITSYNKLIRTLFKQPRKTILNNFSSGTKISKSELIEKLKKMNINPEDRPQNLDLDKIRALAFYFS